MISVQNHHQRSNGSKLIAVALCFFCMSCDLLSGAVGKPAKEDDVVYETNPIPGEKKKTDGEIVKTKPKDKESKGLATVEFQGEEYKVSPHKERFNIALILPFYYNPSTDRERLTSNIMVEYYEGVTMALKQLEMQGFKANLYVFDNRNDTNELKRILRKPEFDSMDLIMGPILESHMDIVSRFSRENGIPAFSPFTAITDPAEKNPLLYSTVPGYKLRASLLVDFIEKEHPGEKLVILRDGGSLDKAFVPFLLEELDKRGTVPYMREAYRRNNRWNILLSSDSANLVYIPTYNRGVVNPSIGGIFSTKRDVTVIGESVWADFDDNDYKFWEATNVHLITYDYVDDADTAVQRFKMAFRSVNNEDPSTYAFMGFDQMTFIGEFLMAFGEHFPMFISEREFTYMSAKYRFIYEDGCNENSNIFILRYADNHLQPVE